MSLEIGPVGAVAPPSDLVYASQSQSSSAKGASTPTSKTIGDTRADAEQGDAKRTASAPEAKMQALLDKLVEGELRPFARLRIERNEDAGAFVYTTVDSRSGDVIRQWPRQEVLEMMSEARESEGVMFDTRV